MAIRRKAPARSLASAQKARSPRHYVAFLRAINVGGRVVKMEALKSLFERLRFDEVATFIASGNVTFRTVDDPARLESTIAAALERALGYPVATFVRTIEEVGRIAAYEPFAATSPGTLYVGFLLRAPAAPEQAAIATLETPSDRLRVQGREVYWLCAGGMMDSTVSYARIEKILGQPATFRNISTVRRLAAKHSLS
jgi:uncharacterized protein (DUF1697 family)